MTDVVKVAYEGKSLLCPSTQRQAFVTPEPVLGSLTPQEDKQLLAKEQLMLTHFPVIPATQAVPVEM